jgi:hypothetical protein
MVDDEKVYPFDHKVSTIYSNFPIFVFAFMMIDLEAHLYHLLH